MAYRRSLLTRAKLFNQYRITPSFPHIHRQDDPEQHPNPSAFNHSRSFGGFSRDSGTTSGFRYSIITSGAFFARHMSTIIGDDGGGGGDKIEYMSDVAGVLTDGAVAAVPAVNEVAVAAADSFLPVAALQYLIDGVHHYTGLPWWGSIAVTTVLIRSLAIPMMINQLKSTSKLTLLRPKLEEIKQEMDESDMSPTAVAEGQQRMKKLFKEYGVTPFTPLKGILIQGPVFISFFYAIENMVEKVPSFKEGGAFWFTDLTTPDSFYILPVMTALSFWLIVESNMQEGLEGNPIAGTMKSVFRAFVVLMVPLTMNFPKALFCYWITSNLFSFVYGLVLKTPNVKKLLGIPDIPVPPPSASQQPAFSFTAAMQKYVQAQRQLASSPTDPSKPASLPTETEPTKPVNQRIPSSSVLSQRIRSLEKEVKGRKKSKKGE